MPTTHDVLSKRRISDQIHYRIEGQGKMRLGLMLRRDAERALADGASAVRVDLRACSYMDSTFMGTLLYLFKALRGEGNGEFCLVSPSEACSQLLEELGIDTLCPIVTEPDTASGEEWEEIFREHGDEDDMGRTVLQAHEHLADLPGPAGQTFRRVVGCLKLNQRSNPPTDS